MSKIYFTLTGTNHYFGKEFLKKGMKIRLEKNQTMNMTRKQLKYFMKVWERSDM